MESTDVNFLFISFITKIMSTRPFKVKFYAVCIKFNVELAWLSSNVMDRHATVRGSIPGRKGVFIEFHVLRKGQ